jgi:hypothetical protein
MRLVRQSVTANKTTLGDNIPNMLKVMAAASAPLLIKVCSDFGEVLRGGSVSGSANDGRLVTDGKSDDCEEDTAVYCVGLAILLEKTIVVLVAADRVAVDNVEGAPVTWGRAAAGLFDCAVCVGRLGITRGWFDATGSPDVVEVETGPRVPGAWLDTGDSLLFVAECGSSLSESSSSELE